MAHCTIPPVFDQSIYYLNSRFLSVIQPVRYVNVNSGNVCLSVLKKIIFLLQNVFVYFCAYICYICVLLLHDLSQYIKINLMCHYPLDNLQICSYGYDEILEYSHLQIAISEDPPNII